MYFTPTHNLMDIFILPNFLSDVVPCLLPPNKYFLHINPLY